MKMPDYTFLPDLVLRTPYYSFRKYDLERLPELLNSLAFRNAMWLASPVFYHSLEKANFDFAQLSARQQHTLSKYYNRMCFRPVPFGSFAAVSKLQWGDGSTVRLGDEESATLHLLPDSDYKRSSRAEIANQGLVGINPLLYRAGKDFRLIYSAPDEKGTYRYELRSFQADRFYTKLFCFIGKEVILYDQLLEWLRQTTGSTFEDAAAFATFLLKQQILFPDDRGDVLIDAKYPPEKRSITPASTSVSGDGNYYSVLTRPVNGGGPDTSDQQELAAAVGLLASLVPPSPGNALQDFKKGFKQRFDQRRVPLLQALDPDLGIDYGAGLDDPRGNLMRDFDFKQEGEPAVRLNWTPVHHLLLKLWPRDRHGIITLTPNDLPDTLVPASAGKWPAILALLFRPAADLLVLDSAGGISGLPLTARFAVVDENIETLCRVLASAEQASGPDCFFADIGQLSDQHVDNINRRIRVFPFELPLNVFPGTGHEQLLLPSDLYLHMAGEELLLETASGKRIIPRLSSAYNYHRNELPLFRFLCDLQSEGLHSLRNFRLRELFPGLSQYPRVQTGRVILSLACWLLRSEELSHLFTENPADRLKALRDFRLKHALPELVSLGDTDQQLVFDLSDSSEATLFLEAVRGLPQVTIHEYLLPPKSVKCGRNPMAGQYVAFLQHQEIVYQQSPQQRPFQTSRRTFPPGSEWLYIQLFCTPAAADELLAKIVHPFMRSVRKKIKTWFFIRYLEDGYHLRLRFRLYHPEDAGPLRTEFCRKLESGGFTERISKHQNNTYERELERYGHNIDQLEQLFCTGSELICARLSLPDPGNCPEFHFAFYTAYQLCCSWLSNDEKRAAFTASVEASLSREHGDSKKLRVSLDKKYRQLLPELKTLIEAGPARFNPALKNIFTQLMAQTKALLVNTSEHDSTLLSDIIHMQMNRTFSREPRQHELLVYACLSRFFKSALARSLKSSAQPAAR